MSERSDTFSITVMLLGLIVAAGLVIAAAVTAYENPVPKTKHHPKMKAAALPEPDPTAPTGLAKPPPPPKTSPPPVPEPVSPPPTPTPGTTTGGGGPTSLPPLLLTIRDHESHGNYQAYNPTGCEGYGCYGAYQLHGLYMDDWARRYGAAAYAGTPANQWPSGIQDRVALGLFNDTAGGMWCDWADYC